MKGKTFYMFSRIKILLFILCTIVTPLYSSSYDDLVSLMWQGREAGAQEHYADAAEILTRVQNNAKASHPGVYKSWDLDQEIAIMKELSLQKPVKDPHIYKVLVIFIKATDAVLKDEDGSLKRGNAVITREEINKTKIFFNYQKQFYRAFSHGHFQVKTDYVETPFKVTRMNGLDSHSDNSADIISIEPNIDYRRFLYKYYNDYDVFCYVWPQPLGKARAEGGIGMQYSLLPYLKKVPQKGFMVIPANWCVSPYTRHTFVHELFHTIEYNLGMFPIHGWMDSKRADVPAFTGKTEYEFYQWRFNTEVLKYPWDQINYKTRYQLHLTPDIFNNYLSYYKQYDFTVNEKAYQAYKEHKIDQGLAFYPQHPLLLYEKAQSLIKNKSYKDAEKIAKALYLLDPDSENYADLYIKTQFELEKYDEVYRLIQYGIENNTFGFWKKISVGYFLKIAARKVKGVDNREKFYNLLVKLNPYNNEYLRLRGHFYVYDKKDFKLAERDFQQGLKNYPEDPLCLIAMGELELNRREYGRAEKLFKQALENTPSFGKKVALAYLYTSYSESDLDTKRKLIEKAMEYDPYYHQSYRDYAFLLRRYNKKQEALDYFKKSADLGNKKSVGTIQDYYSITYTPKKLNRPTPRPDAVTVGVYEIYNGIIQKFEKFFKDVDDIRLVKLSANDILNEQLSGIDVLINPGGNPSDYSRGLGEKGHNIIRNFVKNGGNFIGICAGSFFAIDYKYLDMVDATPFNRYNWFRGTGDVYVHLSDEGKDIFGDIPGIFRMRYANGTMMEPLDKPDMRGYTVLARFTTGLAENGAPDIMSGREAIILSSYEKGKILLFVPHPEYTPGKGYLIRKAVYYLTGKNK